MKTAMLVLLCLGLAASACSSDSPGFTAGTDTDTDSDSDADTDADSDTDGDSDSDADGGADAGTDTDADSDTDTDTDSDVPSPCEEAAAADPENFVCCPDAPPADCEEATWAFSPIEGDPAYYGCSTQDLTTAIWCGDDGFTSVPCDGDCEYTGDYMDCPGG